MMRLLDVRFRLKLYGILCVLLTLPIICAHTKLCEWAPYEVRTPQIPQTDMRKEYTAETSQAGTCLDWTYPYLGTRIGDFCLLDLIHAHPDVYLSCYIRDPGNVTVRVCNAAETQPSVAFTIKIVSEKITHARIWTPDAGNFIVNIRGSDGGFAF